MQPVRSTRRILAAAIAATLLPAVVQAEPSSDELLQKIAWETVSSYPMGGVSAK